MIASVEAIFLPTFVLISENGMAAAADKRVDRCPADPLAGALQNRRLREERRPARRRSDHVAQRAE
jgi:hypothetical protein